MLLWVEDFVHIIFRITKNINDFPCKSNNKKYLAYLRVSTKHTKTCQFLENVFQEKCYFPEYIFNWKKSKWPEFAKVGVVSNFFPSCPVDSPFVVLPIYFRQNYYFLSKILHEVRFSSLNFENFVFRHWTLKMFVFTHEFYHFFKKVQGRKTNFSKFRDENQISCKV